MSKSEYKGRYKNNMQTCFLCNYLEASHQIKKDGFSSNDFECISLSVLWLSVMYKGI